MIGKCVNLKIKKMESDDLKQIVKEKYGRIAEQAGKQNSCCGDTSCCGPDGTYTVFSEKYDKLEGYDPDADLNLGCGIPSGFAGIKKGDHVLDLGSGAGNDCFVARAIVGEEGKVTGLDMTESMIRKARQNCAKLGHSNVEFVLGDIEQMPFEDNSFNVVISNCVLNLVPDKSKAFSEIKRVLRPGGRFCISDVVIKGDLPEKLRKDAEMYAGCISGAIGFDRYLELINDTGFSGVITHKEKRIELPGPLLEEFFDENQSRSFKTGESGIYSVTVSANKTNY